MNRKKYLSFSLWGELPLYTIGAVKNADALQDIYPGWSMIVFHDKNVPGDILDKLKERNVELVLITDESIHPLFWRFFVVDREDCERAIFRDADSRISKREALAVREWIADGTILHVMRDHPFHQIPFGASKLGILGGMWGIKSGYLKMYDLIQQFVDRQQHQEYGVDQTFLETIYQDFQDSKTVHDEFFEGRKFPISRKKYRFVGERIDESEEPVGDDWRHIKEYYKKSKPSLLQKIKSLFS